MPRAADTVIVGTSGGFPIKAGERRTPPHPVAMAAEASARRGAAKATTLKPVHPNAGLEARYRKALLDLVRRMHDSVLFWISAAYKSDPPIMAQDARPFEPRPRVTAAQLRMLLDVEAGLNPNLTGAVQPKRKLQEQGLVRMKPVPAGFEGVREFEITPAGRQLLEDRARVERTTLAGLRRLSDPFVSVSAPGEDLPSVELQRAVGKLTARWQKQFDQAAPNLADYFSTAIEERSDKALQTILRDGGFSVKFTMTPSMQDVLNATTSQNVALIRSIPQQYLTNIEGMVMRSVQAGRDLGTLAKDLEREYGVTKRRAAFISLDQNNKATAAMTRVRQSELGIEEAIWQHSHAGKEPRPTHVANSGKRYNIKTGWYDPAVKKFIFPGELPRCRCVSRGVIPGFN